MSRVNMIAVGPYATGFDTAAHAIGEVGIPRPYPGAEAKTGVSFGRVASASASSLKVVTPITGPKISSWKERISLRPLISVG